MGQTAVLSMVKIIHFGYSARTVHDWELYTKCLSGNEPNSARTVTGNCTKCLSGNEPKQYACVNSAWLRNSVMYIFTF